MRVLPPPRRKGRIGLYDPGHIQRLELIARLQRRGYSLAGIRDLLDAWETGSDLTDVLGLDGRPVTLDETTLRLTRAELSERLPGLDETALRQAEAAGLVTANGPSGYLIRSPALLDLTADGVRLGADLSQMLGLAGVLTAGLDTTASAVARALVERIWRPLAGGENSDQLPAFLARGRIMLGQAVASILADRLAAALHELSGDHRRQGTARRDRPDPRRRGHRLRRHRAPEGHLMSTPNREQAEHWNSAEGAGRWITYQDRHDLMLEPFLPMILGRAEIGAGDRVLDVGCGCGATTRAAAALARPGQVTGIDLSAAMLARAGADARSAGLSDISFIEGDAQVHPFEAASFNVIISRFGLMFFENPVAAFTNLRQAARPRGRLAFACWQPMAANEWLLVPGAALAEHVPLPEPAPADAPGMFALADADRTRSILDQGRMDRDRHHPGPHPNPGRRRADDRRRR